MTAARLNKADSFFTGIVLALSILGYIIFLSAVLSRVGQDFFSFVLIAAKQSVILLVSLVIFFLVSRIHFSNWRQYALPLLLVAIILNLLVFVPGLGISSGGANRWIGLGPISFQPSELLKFAFVLYFAAWLSSIKDKAATIKYGVIPLLILLSLSVGLLLAQPDTGTAGVIILAGLGMFLVGGGKWRYILLVILLGLTTLTFLFFTRPYIKDRILTYFNPASDLLGASYQINQSLIAIGSGGITGRGFGQSIQKFNFLPQPIGDSIFSVAAEEFGFIGSLSILFLFGLYTLWGLRIAIRISNQFGRLLVIGIVILIIAQSLINIGAMLAVIPLTGIPLIFFSQGGSALFLALLESGIIRNISRYKS